MNDVTWTRTQERGTSLGLRIVLFFLNTFGYWGACALLYPIVLYFYLTGVQIRRTTREYLIRLHKRWPKQHRMPSFFSGFKQHVEFAKVTLDRLWLWQGALSRFSFTTEGESLLKGFQQKGRGCFLIGAHVGSFDALRILSQDTGMKVNAVMYTDNATRINNLLGRLNPSSGLNVVSLKDRSIDSIMVLKTLVDNGEMVAVLADRFLAGSKMRSVNVDFLGTPAPFPANPWIVASLLECPVLFVAGLRTFKREYHCVARLATEKVVLPRSDREGVLKKYISQYAAFLESLVEQYPYQWFNFFDFWRPYE